jgi:hypothetical protein
MPFSQWNTLEVPLQNGWQCTLVPLGQYRHAVWAARGGSFDPYPLRRPRWGWPDGRDRPWGHAAGPVRDAWRDDYERQRWERDERERQRDEDRRDFHRYFRPDDDLRAITGRRNLETVRAFLTDIMVFAHWDEPESNEDIRHALSGLVRDRQLVPFMKREWRQLPRVFRPAPAAERWPSGGGGLTLKPAIIYYTEFVALQRANGELGKIALSTTAAMLDPLGDPRVAASGALTLKAASSVPGELGNSTPLGDARAFRYIRDAASGEVQELAASTRSPDYAAKMLGYDRNTFGDMVHAMKYDLNLRGDDNVLWHDSGAVEFRKNIIGNMHDYAK